MKNEVLRIKNLRTQKLKNSNSKYYTGLEYGYLTVIVYLVLYI